MGRSPQEIDEWAVAYIAAQQDPKLLKGDHPLWWAVERLMCIRLDDSGSTAEDAWKVILRVLELDPPDDVVSVLAAGPLEDLIRGHGAAFIDRIEIEARRNVKFRDLLGGVWEGGDEAIWARVDACRGAVW